MNESLLVVDPAKERARWDCRATRASSPRVVRSAAGRLQHRRPPCRDCTRPSQRFFNIHPLSITFSSIQKSCCSFRTSRTRAEW